MIKHKIRKKIEDAQMWIVWRLPRWITKWSYVRVVAYASTNDFSNVEMGKISAMDAFESWSKI